MKVQRTVSTVGLLLGETAIPKAESNTLLGFYKTRNAAPSLVVEKQASDVSMPEQRTGKSWIVSKTYAPAKRDKVRFICK